MVAGSAYLEQKRLFSRRPTWELENMIHALNLFPWLNDEDARNRLQAAKEIVAEREEGS